MVKTLSIRNAKMNACRSSYGSDLRPTEGVLLIIASFKKEFASPSVIGGGD